MERSSRLDRRRLLCRTALAAASVTMPGWLAACFGAGGAGRVADALRAAQREGKPLLVIVIPTGEQARRERGNTFGALLRHGSIEALADLALCRVTCAAVDELDRHVHAIGTSGHAEPWAVLVETSGRSWVGQPLHPQLPALAEMGWSEAGTDTVSASIERRIDALGAALSAPIAGTRDLLEHRARTARAAASPHAVAAIEADLAQPERLDLELAHRGAALLRLAAEDAPDERHLSVLARATQRRLVDGTPDGARWATASGCGIEIDGEPQENCGILCGMAFVPEVSQRFLTFYTAS